MSKRVSALQTSSIRKIFDLAGTVNNPLDLSLGVPALPVPQVVKEAAVREIFSDRKGYSTNAGFLDVRQKIADKLKRVNKIQATPEEVIVTSGLTAGLWLALASILDAGDEIIIFDPYFVPYINLIEFLGAKAIKINTYPDWEIPWNNRSNATNWLINNFVNRIAFFMSYLFA